MHASKSIKEESLERKIRQILAEIEDVYPNMELSVKIVTRKPD